MTGLVHAPYTPQTRAHISTGRRWKALSSLSKKVMSSLKELCAGLPVDPIPPPQEKRDVSVPHAPVRTAVLSDDERRVRITTFQVQHLHAWIYEALQVLSHFQ